MKDDDKSYLGHASLLQPEEGTPEGTVPPPGTKLTPVDFYSKNPALAQREFSEVVERSPSQSKFRLTSHNVMNPNNKPDAFEEGALREIRDGNLKEYYELTDNGFRYARAVYQKASCIACHGDREQRAQRRQGPLRHDERLRLQGRRRRRHHQRAACRRSRSGTWRSTWSAYGSS